MYKRAAKAGSNEMFLDGIFEGIDLNFWKSVSAATLESHLQRQCWSTNFWNPSCVPFSWGICLKGSEIWKLLRVASSRWVQKVKMMFNCCLITAPYCYFHSKQQAVFLPTACLNIYPCKLFPCSSKSFFLSTVQKEENVYFCECKHISCHGSRCWSYDYLPAAATFARCPITLPGYSNWRENEHNAQNLNKMLLDWKVQDERFMICGLEQFVSCIFITVYVT